MYQCVAIANTVQGQTDLEFHGKTQNWNETTNLDRFHSSGGYWQATAYFISLCLLMFKEDLVEAPHHKLLKANACYGVQNITRNTLTWTRNKSSIVAGRPSSQKHHSLMSQAEILISTVHLLTRTFLKTGPFWISSTTIIILYFSSTLAGYLAALHSETKYYYDFTLLSAAAGLMYGYAGIIPTILWGAMKWYGCEPSLLEILCLYGYGGMIVWIPVVCTPIMYR